MYDALLVSDVDVALSCVVDLSLLSLKKDITHNYTMIVILLSNMCYYCYKHYYKAILTRSASLA